MIVVNQCVSDARRGQRRGKLWLPDSFSQPCAAGPLSEVFFDVVGEPDNLFVAVSGRNRDHNGLIVAAADHFYLSASHHQAQPFEILWMAVRQQLEQRTGEM